MHDPMSVAFDIRRPWPRCDAWETRRAAKKGIRWKADGAFWIMAGRGLYWPSFITVWHRDPSGYDHTTCDRKRWALHVHHWRIQVRPLQTLRRRLLTRCAWCQGRDRKGDPVNISHAWERAGGHWWRGESGVFHKECSSIERAHANCTCEHPVIVAAGRGRCSRCMRHRFHGATEEQLARMRELARIPHGERSAA